VCEELGGNGRKYIEDKLSIERIGLQMKKIFRALLMRGYVHASSCDWTAGDMSQKI